MNSDFRDKLSNAATVVEITLGMVILIACIVSGIGMVAMTVTGCSVIRRIYCRRA